MHSHRRDEDEQPAGLVQSVGAAYLSVTAVLLLIVAVLGAGGATLWSRLAPIALKQAPAAAPTPAPKPAATAAEAAERKELYAQLAKLGGDLAAEANERNRLARRLEELLALRAELSIGNPAAVEKAGATPEDVQAAVLKRIEEIERELANLAQALDASEKKIAAEQVNVAGLGARLNRALAAKVEELSRERSDFFARLRSVLSDRPGFHIEGDRFALGSEVLFAPGSANLLPQGLDEVRRLAATINAVRADFPPDVAWVLRVSGHTDKRPINNERFPSNWELSTMRAVTVVKALIAEGVPPEHVAAAGFGEFQPIAEGDEPAILARNRRIEFRLDQP